jgi:hypothetical protein
MRPRYLLVVAIVWGVVGTLGAPTAQAQGTPNSPKAVKLFLKLIVAPGIKADTKALNMRDKDVAKLDATTNPKLEAKLTKTLNKLHNQILSLTLKLQAESVQAFLAAKSLSPANPTLVSQALGSIMAIEVLSNRAGLPFHPATSTK